MFGRYTEVYLTYSLADKDAVRSALQAQGIPSRVTVQNANGPMRSGVRSYIPFQAGINQKYRYQYTLSVKAADAERAAYVIRELGK